MKITYGICFILGMVTGNASAMAELPDPTRPADYNVAPEIVEINDLPKELIDWRVTAIRIAGEDRTAIVNDHLVRVGDKVGPARILEINSTTVVLDYEDKQLLIRLFGNVIQKKERK